MPRAPHLQQPPQHARVAERAVPLLAGQVEPLDQRVERVGRAVGVERAAQPHRAERLRLEREAGALELGPQEAVVEAGVVSDEDGAVEPVDQVLRHRFERRRRAHHLVGDPGQPLDLRRDRHAGIDQRGPLVDRVDSPSMSTSTTPISVTRSRAGLDPVVSTSTKARRGAKAGMDTVAAAGRRRLSAHLLTAAPRRRHAPARAYLALQRAAAHEASGTRQESETHMTISPEADKAARLSAVAALIEQRVEHSERSGLLAFAASYFHRIDPEDIATRDVEDLYGALLSHWQFAQRREPGKAKIRVISPVAGEHGWSSRHTVVEIVNDDMPFLVDSASMEVNRQGLTLHLIVHPIFAVERDAGGALKGLYPREERPDGARESFMHIEVDRLADPMARAQLAEGIERVLGDVRAAVTDWKAMVAQLRAVIADIDRQAPPLAREEVTENRDFLQWLAEDHLLLLGYRQHDFADHDGELALKIVPGTGLGMLRDADGGLTEAASLVALPPQARELATAPSPMLMVTKANNRSTVHRPGYIDYIGVKRYGPDGQAIGEHRFLGLFTSTTYSARVSEIPLLRGKKRQVLERAGLAPASHLGKALEHILETYPRDELFQISTDELHEIANGILQLGERQRFRLFIRRDPFERFISCLIYVPRENYTTELRRKFQSILLQAFDGSSADFDVLLTDAVLARIHMTVRTNPGRIPAYDRRDVERRLADASRRWEDDLRQALSDEEGEARAAQLCKRFGNSFPASYRENVSARAAVADVRRLDGLRARRPRAQPLSPARGAGRSPRLQGVSRGRTGRAVELAADARAHGRARAVGAAVRGRAGAGRPVLDPRLRARPGRARRDRCGEHRAAVRGRVPARDDGRGGERRLQSPRAARFAVGRRDHGAAGVCEVHAAERLRAVAGVHRGHAREPSADRAAAGAAVQAPVRPEGGGCCRGDEPGERDRAGAGEGQQPERGPGAAAVPRADPRDVAHELLADRSRRQRRGRAAAAVPVVQVRPVEGPRAARAASDVRDLRVLDALRGRAPARRQGGARRPALVRPAGGLPHRGAGPRQGADGEEHRHRAGRQQGRLRAEEGAARHRPRGAAEGRHRLLPELPARTARPHRQPGRRQGRAAAARGSARRRRPVSRRRGGQGDGHVLRLRQRDQQGVRALARRRVRLRRQRGLRPQGDGHHRARCVGERQAALPRARRRHAGDRLHRGRHRRHVRRRVRQRHAAVAPHPARGRVRPSPRVPRPESGRRGELRRARADLRVAALLVGGLRRGADFGGRRRLGPFREVDPRLAAGAGGARHRRRRG